jgi:hypothetical protein
MRFDQNHTQYDGRAVGKSEMSIWWCWKREKCLDVQTGEHVTGNLEDLTFRNRASYIQDGHTATLQTPHFIYFFNKYTYWVF